MVCFVGGMCLSLVFVLKGWLDCFVFVVSVGIIVSVISNEVISVNDIVMV